MDASPTRVQAGIRGVADILSLKSRRWGGALWVGCLQFFVAEAIAAADFSGAYSFRRNYISDLGAVGCGAGCSPLNALMNASFVLQGVLIVTGTAVVWALFPRGALSWLALGLVAASGLGVALVGLAPEDSAPGWHYLGAAENLLFCNVGAALFGVALLHEGQARAAGRLSLAFGLIGLAGLAGLAVGHDFGLGAGGVERVAAYPFPLWIAGMGAWLIARDDIAD
jgi:hypothetical membrane protein